MRTTYTLDGKRISKKMLNDLIGEKLVTSATRDAWCTHLEDPQIENTIWVGYGILKISFS